MADTVETKDSGGSAPGTREGSGDLSSFLNTFESLGEVFGNVYGAVRGSRNDTPAAAAPAAQDPAANQKLIFWIAGGFALLIVAMLLFRNK